MKTTDLKTYFFTPKHTSVDELHQIAQELYGRSLWLEERGGLASRPVENLQRLGDALIVYDVPDYAQRLGEALHAMDQQAEQQAAQHEPLEVAEWSPGYISLDMALAALQPFKIYSSAGEGLLANIAVAPERQTLVLHDEPQRVEAMLSLLKSLDRPEPQLNVTCLVIRGSRGEVTAAESPPDDLVAHLGRLVPFPAFAVQTRGVLRSSALSREIQLRMDEAYRLVLMPDAFDAESQSLTVRCEFSAKGAQGFETRTTIRQDEYTVLGATGAEPIFVVLRLQRID